MNFTRTLMTISLAILLSGCGQAGGLYLPQQSSTQHSQQETGEA